MRSKADVSRLEVQVWAGLKEGQMRRTLFVKEGRKEKKER